MSGIWEQVVTGRPDEGEWRTRLKPRRPGTGEKLVLVPLEPEVGWYLTHFVGKRTRPCLGEQCGCLQAEHPVTTRWVGWILAIEKYARKIVLANLTAGCWETCQELRIPELNLRGCDLILTRKTTRSNGPVSAEVFPGRLALARVPVLPYTHRDALMSVWFGPNDPYTMVALYTDLAGAKAPLSTRAQPGEGGEA
jgi:hypothetical protein